MLLALSSLHASGVCHQDIKPHNVLINFDGTVKLADFGCSLSTIGYRSPEIILRRKYTPASDMWSFGCMVYELFTGQQLFHCRSGDLDQLSEILSFFGLNVDQVLDFNDFILKNRDLSLAKVNFDSTKEIRLPGVLHSEVRILLTQMLSLNAGERVTAADLLKHDFFKDLSALKPFDGLPRLKHIVHSDISLSFSSPEASLLE